MGESEHCAAHVANMERMARLEAREDGQDEKFDVIFNKLDDQAEILRCLKSGQDVILAKFSAFERGYNERVEVSNSVIAEYRLAMVGINAKFVDIAKVLTDHLTEYRKFDWFRNWVNGIQQELPKTIAKSLFWFLMTIAVLMTVVHKLDFERLLKWIGLIK